MRDSGVREAGVANGESDRPARLVTSEAPAPGSGGITTLTTHRVAKEAGVSVGSLYQSFPNEDALVSGLVEGWADGMADQFAALGPVLADAPVDDCVRRIVEATLEVTRADAPLHRSVLLQLPRIGPMEFFERLNRRVADVLAEWISLRRAELDVEDASRTAYVIVTSLDALLDHALPLRPDLLESRRFARELERLVSGCLGLPRAKSSIRRAPSAPTRASTRRSRSR